MKKVICILIGFAISGAVLFPLFKKRRAEEKVQEEELLKKVDEMTKEALDEELKHRMTMEDIERKGGHEMNQELEEYKKNIEQEMSKVNKIMADYNAIMAGKTIRFMMKYEDENGVIHEFDAGDPKQFREVLNTKTYRLIFD